MGSEGEKTEEIEVVEIRHLRSMCSTTRIIDRTSHGETRRRVRVQSDLSGRVEKCVMRWFGHVERMTKTNT